MEICYCPYQNNTSKFYPLVAGKDIAAGAEIVFNFRRIRDIIDVSFIPDNDCVDDPSKERYADLCKDCRQQTGFVNEFACEE